MSKCLIDKNMQSQTASRAKTSLPAVQHKGYHSHTEVKRARLFDNTSGSDNGMHNREWSENRSHSQSIGHQTALVHLRDGVSGTRYLSLEVDVKVSSNNNTRGHHSRNITEIQDLKLELEKVKASIHEEWRTNMKLKEQIAKQSNDFQSKVDMLTIQNDRELKALKEEYEYKLQSRSVRETKQDTSTLCREQKELKAMVEQLEHELEDEKKKFEEGYAKLRNKYENRLKERKINEKAIDDPSVDAVTLQLKKVNEELANTQAELLECRDRLSKLMGQKLTDNNPNIADLSDKNRPTKLAERYRELYDNQWTDAFEVVNNGNEKETIRLLICILREAMEFCVKESAAQMKRLQQELLMTENNTCSSTIYKHLKDLRKLTAEITCRHLYKVFFDIQKSGNKSYSSNIDRIESYIRECFELCWFMSVQDPPVVLSEIVQTGSSFNTDIYRAYTQSGKRVEYVVWPALLLHQGGRVLSKGVAQAQN